MDAAFTVLFTRITGPWANGVSKTLIAMMSPLAAAMDAITGGKASEKIADMISGVSAEDRAKSKGMTFKEALADANKKPTWLESQGKEAGIMSGQWLDEGLDKLKKSTKGNVGITDYAGLFGSFMKNAKEFFPTDELRNQFEDVMKPYLAAARKDFEAMPEKKGEKALGAAPEDKGSRGFVGFKDAIKQAQEKMFDRAEKQRDKQIELLTAIKDANKAQQEALFN
jgi:hypothetical protein